MFAQRSVSSVIHRSCYGSGLNFQSDFNSLVGMCPPDPFSSLCCLVMTFDTQQSQMTRGLLDNPSRLIITPSSQWRKPDPKYSTARHEQPTALLINERQLPWLPLCVCVLKRKSKESERHTFKVIPSKTSGMRGGVSIKVECKAI